MSKKKKILIFTSIAVAVVLAITAVILVIVLVKKKKNPDPVTPAIVYEVSLDSEQFSMILGDEKPLIANYTRQGETELVFTSSDETVVKVDEYGRLTALKIGTATITVQYGTASDSCVVTVGTNGLLPLLQFSNVSAESVYIEKETKLDLSGIVLFNGKTYTDVELTYAVEDENVGKVENGVFTPSATGTTEITVNASWRGVTGASLSKTIVVEVKPTLVFMVNGGVNEITLYTQTERVSPFEITATYDNVTLPTSVEITQGSEFIEYNETEQKVKSRGRTGEAEISVSYELDGEDIVKTFPVHVKPSIYDYQTTVENFSAIHGDVVKGTTLRALLGGDIVSATDANGNALKVDSNKIYGVESSNSGKFETTITIYAATHGYRMHIEGYSGIFARAEDFAVFNTNTKIYQNDKTGKPKDFYPIDENKPMQKWEGYYVLANNIKADNYVHKAVGENLTGFGIKNERGYNYGFHGTFDGQGYTVDGMTVGAYGIFGYLVNATVKDVAFANVTLKNEKYATAIAGWIINSTLSNVYVGIANDTKLTTDGAVFACGMNVSTLKGCIVETKETFGYAPTVKTQEDPVTQEPIEVETPRAYTGSFTWQSKELSDRDEKISSFMDVYVISGEKLGYYKTAPYYLIAENDETLDLEEGFDVYTLVGVKRYATRTAMQEAENSYTYFASRCWTLDSGAPVWKSLNGEYPSADEIISDEIPKKETVGGFDVEWL